MRSAQQKKAEFVSKIQKQQRQQIRAQNRVWNELPSVIVELPARIDQNDWNHFEDLLDSITENDLMIIDQQLVDYLNNRLGQAQKDANSSQWTNNRYFNILRAMVRMRIISLNDFSRVISMLQDSHQQFLNTRRKQDIQGMLKLVKQIAIYLESGDPQITLGENNKEHLKKVVSSMKIYMCWFQTKMETFAEIFQNYRLYYIALVAHPFIEAEFYVNSRNIGELYCLIEDSLRHKQNLEIVKSVEVILKILKLDDSLKENRFTLNGLHILLIDGLQRAKLYTSSFEHIEITAVTFQFDGIFFSELLRILNNCEVETLIHSIQLLGQLFQIADCYIEAVMKTNNKSVKAELEQNLEKKAVRIKRAQFLNYAQFFLFSMSSILGQVRYKTFWVLSNILGSQKFFFEYGFQFFKAIFEANVVVQEEQNAYIMNEIIICILNFICNLHLIPSIVSRLAQTSLESQEQKFQENKKNAFQFALETVLKQIDQLYNISETQQILSGARDNFQTILHRSLYALYVLIEVVRQQKQSKLQEQIFGQAHKRRIPLYLQNLATKLKKGGNWQKVEDLLQQILDIFARETVSV